MSNFVLNLNYACGYYRSIADICRKIGINRQQFNKYLSGQVRPSRGNMRKICDFFGITESEILSDHAEFRNILSALKGLEEPDAVLPPEAVSHVHSIYKNSRDMRRYSGYYFRYFYSFDHPGHIIKSFASLYEYENKFYWKNIEIQNITPFYDRSTSVKYSGVAFFLSDRIFILEYDSLLKNSITQAILYPSYHAQLKYLQGIQTGASTLRGRKPAASFVLLQYLGSSINIRKALKSCGIYSESSEAIDSKIRDVIRNNVAPTSYVFEADPI